MEWREYRGEVGMETKWRENEVDWRKMKVGWEHLLIYGLKKKPGKYR